MNKHGLLGRLGLVTGILTSNGLILLREGDGAGLLAFAMLGTLSLLGFALYVLNPMNGGNNEH